MAFKPNYRFERIQRTRDKESKKAAKRAEKAARKAAKAAEGEDSHAEANPARQVERSPALPSAKVETED